jgi:hypothetical protein
MIEEQLDTVNTSADTHRDRLLAIAREAVQDAARQGADPSTVAARILAAWLSLGIGVSSTDHGFELDERTGVEALAFVVIAAETRSGGVILRLAGEYPDSFDPVTWSGAPLEDPIAVRRSFFSGGARPV